LVTLYWLVTGGAFVLALLALARARRTATRLQRLTESYWELRYEHTQLRARVTALEPPQGGASRDAESRQTGGTAFVPLSSLKR
jgi:hypothetical protein